jgi:hypothetical protein
MALLHEAVRVVMDYNHLLLELLLIMQAGAAEAAMERNLEVWEEVVEVALVIVLQVHLRVPQDLIIPAVAVAVAAIPQLMVVQAVLEL